MSRYQTDIGYKKLDRQSRSSCCRCWKRRSCCFKMTVGISVFVVIAVSATVVGIAISMPLHASCKIDWTFGIPCNDVKTKLVNQISTWSSDDNCANGGEKCLYSKSSESANELKAKHETPKAHYVDDLTFTFTSADNSCKVHGFSTSETWYALLDYGTNYCNLHNLIEGAGLDKVAGYTETTSNSICTQYSSANCTVY